MSQPIVSSMKVPSRRSRASHGARAGFTLIELLVVIAIITLIIGLLLPAIASARAAARQTGCLSDMRQMGLALNLYCNDFKERLP